MSNPVCKKIRALRLQHNLTQMELASKAKIPRASLANMESEKGNPSIIVVTKVAEALGVTIDDLVENKDHSSVTKVKRGDMQVNRQDEGKFAITLLSPLNAPYINVNEINMLPGCYSKGKPHPKGSHEFFYCLEGTAVLEIQGDAIEVKSGDLVYFPGNLPHVYSNPGIKPVHAVAVVNIVELSKR
ncbi:MAG: helix-turn-helix domain-containing protein [SAR324 cluster bacterium]|nr:helix-turn-helix domain-containing protein [SAR324 cluster bacterium]